MSTLNVLIVDDEAHIRAGIRGKVDWERLGMRIAAEASDGAEALKEIETGHIDLVMTDMNMPLMDGLTLIRKTTETNRDIKFIVISGYSEFEYARTAMKYGITEYLLKPLKESEMIAALMKLKAEIDAAADGKEQAKRERGKLREEALSHLLTDKFARATPAELEKALSVRLAGDAFAVGVVKIEPPDGADGPDDPDDDRLRIIARYRDVERCLEAVIEAAGHGLAVKWVRPEHEFVLLLATGGHPDGRGKLSRELGACLRRLETELGVRATIGLGGPAEREQSLKPSYSEAVFASKEKLLRGVGNVIDYASIPLKREKPNFGAEVKLLVRLLEERKWDSLRSHLDAAICRSVQRGLLANHNHMNELFMEMYFAVKQYALGTLSDPAESAMLDMVEDIGSVVVGFSQPSQMVEWLYAYAEAACSRAGEGQDTSGKEIVYRVKKYIKEFYSSDLTLSKISEKYHINPIYFSRIFKTHVGESFNAYITRVRMEEAKHLMETTSLKLQDISEIVGYDDPKYFSKVFKKFFGVSPSLYGEQG